MRYMQPASFLLHRKEGTISISDRHSVLVAFFVNIIAMNPWMALSIEYANQRSYLDDLFQVYPTIPEGSEI